MLLIHVADETHCKNIGKCQGNGPLNLCRHLIHQTPS
jgi:hypothetical protein